MPTLTENFHNNLRELLRPRGTRARIIREMNMSPNLLAGYLNRKYSPKLDQIERIAKFFKIPPTELIRDWKAKPSKEELRRCLEWLMEAAENAKKKT